MGQRPAGQHADVVCSRVRQQVSLDVAAERVIGRLDGFRRQHRSELGDLVRAVVGDPHVPGQALADQAGHRGLFVH